ncbi:MAG: 4-aminobutyrate--2-oxoglutarate transaminase [Rhodobacteraceae bacterium]|nr:4-aminobutyrate--2-oxoglutarate transaminase [Paracoccaceae bacterium]
MTKTSELMTRKTAALANGLATKNIFAVKAAGSELWDADGKRYIDFAAGIAVVNTGHCHPKVMAAVTAQAENFTHTCFHVAPYESYIRLAERLNAMAPGDAPKKTMLVTTGVEAVENAVKLARAFTGRGGVVAFSGGFHGRTLMGMSLTGKQVPYKSGFGPMVPEVFHAPYPNALHGISTEQALADVERLMRSSIEPNRIAAFILEPIQGEGGFVIAPHDFLRSIRDLADKHGIVMISDEVQAGMGRTGTMFGIEHSGVVPDLITMAKGLAGGFPLSAITGRAEIMDASEPGSLGGTYGGNPLAVVAANAVLDVIEEEELCIAATRIGGLIMERLGALAAQPGIDVISDVRGVGAMVAFEFVTDRESNAPDPSLVNQIIAEAQERGLILLSCGTRANVIRLLPPLTTSDAIIAEALDIIEASVKAAIAKSQKVAAE